MKDKTKRLYEIKDRLKSVGMVLTAFDPGVQFYEGGVKDGAGRVPDHAWHSLPGKEWFQVEKWIKELVLYREALERIVAGAQVECSAVLRDEATRALEAGKKI